MEAKNTFGDTSGVPSYKFLDYYLWISGHWVRCGQDKAPKRLKVYRLFGCLLCAVVGYMAISVVNAVKISLAAKDLSSIGNGLVILSTMLSMLHKYSIFLSQDEGVSRLTSWMKTVQKRNEDLKVEYSKSEAFLRKSMSIFYYGALISPWILIFGPIIRGEPYCHKFPFASDRVEKLITLPLVVIVYNVLAWEVAFTATSLINILVTFRSEVQRLGEEWTAIRFDPENPKRFAQDIKINVEKHVFLCKVFKDVKRLNNSMFGYQVFAAIFTTCAVIYGSTKVENFLYISSSQVLPISAVSLLEFALLCWLGEEITFGFQQYHRNVHLTNWYEAPLEALTSLTVILEFSKTPMKLTGFTVFTATLQTLLETMKQSFSLYTLLKAIT